MGRKPTVNLNLPKKLRARKQKSGRTFYYLEISRKPHKELALGSDYLIAVQKWSKLLLVESKSIQGLITFRKAAEKYFKSSEYEKLADRTKSDYKKYSKKVFEFFDNPPAPLDLISPINIKEYQDWRVESPIQANRERAFISLVWNYGRTTGLTDKPNPCIGIRKNSEKGRKKMYTEDKVMEIVWNEACIGLRDAIDLAYLTAQRPSDTLKMSEEDIKIGYLKVIQGKTGMIVNILIEGELKEIINRIVSRKSNCKIKSKKLIVNEQGKPFTQNMYRDSFDKARALGIRKYPELELEIKSFQFRDLRAKAATDITESDGIERASKLLGHASLAMTEHYVRGRAGTRVKPTK